MAQDNTLWWILGIGIAGYVAYDYYINNMFSPCRAAAVGDNLHGVHANYNDYNNYKNEIFSRAVPPP